MLLHASVHANKDLLNSCISAHIVIQEQAFWISLTVKLDMTHRACNRLDNNTLINGHTYRQKSVQTCGALIMLGYLRHFSVLQIFTERDVWTSERLVTEHLQELRSNIIAYLELCFRPLDEHKINIHSTFSSLPAPE